MMAEAYLPQVGRLGNAEEVQTSLRKELQTRADTPPEKPSIAD